ncbi:MAG: preprotein translocase subunit SecG, partial [Paludibacteraceae bacterium]|nr:preprotein translocase subunit SecG [Paludibacteraceae bacterium]
NQVMGAPKTADFLEKATWTLISVIIVLSIFAVGLHKQNMRANDSESAISEQVQEAASEMQQQAATPAFDESEEAE